jgi:sporulation protein YlmC with PRC-barrel domain
MIAQGILITGAALLAGAQSPEKQNCEQWSKDHWNDKEWSRVSDVLGSEVHMKSAMESDSRPSGELDELLLDPETGKVSWAVVSCGRALGMGEHDVAVPASKLKWNCEQEGWELSMTEDQLRSSPDFDLSKARDENPEAAFRAVEASWNKDVSEFPRFDEHDENAQTMKVGDMEVRPCTADFVLASELDEHPVYARSEEFGDVSGSVLDLRNNRVAYAIVDRGGVMGIGEDKFLIPFDSMTVRECTKSSKPIFCVDRPVSEVESKHRYEKPEDGVISPHAAHEARERSHS